jgi:hypothetical protein
MTPPTLQNAPIYSGQLWYKFFIGITAFLGKNFCRSSMIVSTNYSPTATGFFLRFCSDLIWSMLR